MSATISNQSKLQDACTQALFAGLTVMHITINKEDRFPKGFPRVELLSINPNTGDKNYAVDAFKLQIWLHKEGSERTFQ